MPRQKTTIPEQPTREKGQRSLDLPSYLYMVVPQYRRPAWLRANLWRNFVRQQPVAMIVKDTLISNFIDLDWSVEPRDTRMRDEHKSEIEEYTKFIENDGNYDYADRTEILLEDLLDTPFGVAMETIREGDSPDGKVLELIQIDADTLFPTLNKKWPVGQVVEGSRTDPIYFPAHAINRIKYAPRPEIEREGWGMPPPERIYLAMELLSRGDKYYATLLLDTPPPGILDLMDMERESAVEWIQSFREFMAGNEVLKIPVLYEHTQKAEWISFGKNPNELAYDSVTLKYAAMVAAAYGMTLSDIGFSQRSNGGETLSGTIRQERKARRTGIARVKKKVQAWYNRLLPEYLEFKFVDIDDEVLVSVGRGRLATITAINQAIESGMLTAEEGRQQIMYDGLISIAIPESLPPEAKKMQMLPGGNGNGTAPERPSMIGRPVNPSQGGFGEKNIFQKNLSTAIELPEIELRRMIRTALKPSELQAESVLANSETREEVDMWLDVYGDILFENYSYIQREEVPESLSVSISNTMDMLEKSVNDSKFHEFNPDEIVSWSEELFKLYKTDRANYLYETGEINTLPEISVPREIITGITDISVNLFEKARKEYRKIVLNSVLVVLLRFTAVDSQDKLHDNKLMKEIIAEIDMESKSIISKYSRLFVEEFAKLVEEDTPNAKRQTKESTRGK